MMLKLFVVLAATMMVGNAQLQLFSNKPPRPNRNCQKWCPRPGQIGQYDCCDNLNIGGDSCATPPGSFCTQAIMCGSDGKQYNNGCAFSEAKCRNPGLVAVPCNNNEPCVDKWPGICIDGLKRFDNGTQIKVGGCSCAGIKATGWCDSKQGTKYCRKTCGFCADDPSDSCATPPGSFCTEAIICGSDGRQYNNGCAFSEAKCRNPGLVPGPCQNNGDSCATPPGTFCTQAIMCGSDGRQYNNGCAFSEAKCRNPGLVAVPCNNNGGRPTGKCPNTSGIITTCAITPGHCLSDSECPRGTKCCSRGCGRECLPVV